MEWGLNMMQTGGFTLRELERKAKQEKAGIWEGYVPPVTAAQARTDAFKGPVVEVVSGDCVVVRDAAGKEHKLHLSSIRAPRLGRRGEVPEAWALEAKEHLRSRCVVDVVVLLLRLCLWPGGDEACCVTYRGWTGFETIHSRVSCRVP